MLEAVVDTAEVAGWVDNDSDDEGVDDVDLDGDESLRDTLTLRSSSPTAGFFSEWSFESPDSEVVLVSVFGLGASLGRKPCIRCGGIGGRAGSAPLKL